MCDLYLMLRHKEIQSNLQNLMKEGFFFACFSSDVSYKDLQALNTKIAAISST